MNEPSKLDFNSLRSQVVGADATVATPFGDRLMVYADYTASGRCLGMVEKYIQNLQRIYANTHTEDDISGRSMTQLLEQAEHATALVLVPMFPHSLTSRPIAVSGQSEIRIDVVSRNDIHPPITCDGQISITALPGDSVRIRKKARELTLLHPPGYSFYASCRDKLRWSDALVK